MAQVSEKRGKVVSARHEVIWVRMSAVPRPHGLARKLGEIARRKVVRIAAAGVLLIAAPIARAADRSEFDVVTSAMVPTAKPAVVRAATTELDGDDLAVDELLKIATFEEESLRLAAAEVLAEIATPRARAALGIVLYGNSMGTVRAKAADLLGAWGDGETVFALALALETERDHEVRDVIAANLEASLEVEPALVPGTQVAKLPPLE